ncbi:LOW QUALITY PROTEIN: serine/arginine repetitive matrix protein 3-like [Lutra lutra]|uniref:LOW QUALITY PROTEIN: serine/arginine repetitive matrix protein 3-like n=1 Tax=Lutra lutra TaxID=9657 RepID=UPI001FD3BC89|nr:LOW QUALITY PROTEIN: serine/arginine repetitive matrix protein 3-like [Lutra lutra]
MPGAAGGSRAPADSSQSPAARPGRRGGGGRGEALGGRRPRSSEARAAGKPQEGGREGGAGAGWQLPGSPEARGRRQATGREPRPQQPARRVRGLPAPLPQSCSASPAPAGVRWGRGPREAPPTGPCRTRPAIGRGRVPNTSAGLGGARGRGALPPPFKTCGVSGKRPNQLPGPGRPQSRSHSWYPPPSLAASALVLSLPRAGSRPGPGAFLSLLANLKALCSQRCNRGTRELQEGA